VLPVTHARLSLIVALALTVLAGAAEAQCYADYKAKQDDPLRLHYGVLELPGDACNRGAAEDNIAPRLRAAGWQLLNVVSVFGPEGLDERKANAGEFYLRF
jgi:hypothetical protein